jgi:DNA-binding transcriptional MocR family regulator
MELPDWAPDAAVLAARAIEQGVVLAPGPVFSPSHQWGRFLRVNIAQSSSPRFIACMTELLRPR